MKRVVLLLTCSLAASGRAQEPQLPTDVELKASYCVAVTQGIIGMSHGALSSMKPDDPMYDSTAKTTAASEDNLRRLQGYLIPKISHLDAVALGVAHRRGQEDFATAKKAIMTCVDRCMSSPNLAAFTACNTKCRAEIPAITRTNRCNDVNWLPF